jgi:hypothetical protein
MASTVLKAAGFQGEALATALGVSFVECDGPAATKAKGRLAGYGDAVGDLTLINGKWGPSLSLFQIRTLRHPGEYSYPDTLRIAELVRFPDKNAVAAFAISKRGTDWTPWSAYKSGAYLEYVGKDFEIVTGHPRAELWNA